MHFHDSFIAHFFPVLSLSCCHKQTSAVLLLFIIHKSNKVASQDGARRHSRGVLHHSFLLLRSFVHIHFVLCLEDLSYSLLQFSPARLLSVRIRENGSDGLCWLPSSEFLRTSFAGRRERKSYVTGLFRFLSSSSDEGYLRGSVVLITR